MTTLKENDLDKFLEVGSPEIKELLPERSEGLGNEKVKASESQAEKTKFV